MSDKIALKRLTASDLTFFERLFRSLDVGNQKSINLNADIFVDRFYPTLPDQVSTIGDVINVSLTIFGPNGAVPYVLSRAITKRDAYKNWRLNGEFVYDPDGQVGRFDRMTAGDLAVFEFNGEPAPQKVTLLLISSASPGDAALHSSLGKLVPGGRRTMIEVSRQQLAAAASSVPPAHPIWALAADPEFDAALEDAAGGGTEGVTKLAAKESLSLSAATLSTARVTAEKNGRDGEALAWLHLRKLHELGQASEVEWVSKTNALSPYSFSAVLDGERRLIDVKSTRGNFERPLHLSIAAATVAAQCEHYDLWRIYNLDQDGARLRIASDIRDAAQSILYGISMPEGVVVNAVSMDPTVLTWAEEVVITRPDEDDNEQ